MSSPWAHDYFGNTSPWFWNDPVVRPGRNCPPWEQILPTNDLCGLHRALDNDHKNNQLRQLLSDAHSEAGDDEGAEFWQWWASRRYNIYAMDGNDIKIVGEGVGGYPAPRNEFWWFDNQMLLADESPHRIPLSFIRLMESGRHLSGRGWPNISARIASRKMGHNHRGRGIDDCPGR